MNLSELKSVEDRAIDTVVAVLNRAKEKLGVRQTLQQLATTRENFLPSAKVSLTSLGPPLAITSEHIIKDAIEKKWKLIEVFKYTLLYKGTTMNECSKFYYFESIFSQPTAAYPIPQTTASVFFRVEDKHVEPPGQQNVPNMIFRIEGHRQDHDIRYVTLTADWILAVLRMKMKLFSRVEGMKLF